MNVAHLIGTEMMSSRFALGIFLCRHQRFFDEDLFPGLHGRGGYLGMGAGR